MSCKRNWLPHRTISPLQQKVDGSTPGTTEFPSREFMTTANKVTVFRILLVPAFAVQLLYYFKNGDEQDRLLAALFFAVAAILDGVDGYIARRYHQKSRLGMVLDPVADKMLLISAILLLSLYPQELTPRIPTWLTAVVISRDVILLLGMGVVHYTCGKVQVMPRLIGKAATVLQIATVVWALLQWEAAFIYYLSLAAAITTGLAGVLAVRDGLKQLSQSPLSSPDHRL